MAKLIEITGKALSGEWGIDDVDGTGIPVLRTTNFTNEGIVNYENIVTRKIPKKNIDEKYLIQGDIIIEKSGGSDKQPVGRVVFFEGLEHKYLFNNFTGLLRIKDKDKWEPKYIFYSLYSNYRKGGTKAFENKTTGLHNLKTDDYISRLNIKDTAIEEQRNICRKLDIICKIIKLQQEQFYKLDNLIKSQFVEVFGDPVINPKGWDEINISEIINGKVSNGFFAKRDDYTTDGNVSVLGVANVVNRMYSQCENLPKTNGTENDIKKFQIQYGDLLFCRSSLVAEGIGKASVVPQNVPQGVLFECHVIRLPLNLEKCIPEYVQMLTTTDYYRNQIRAQAKTATMTTIGQDGILKTNILLPPLELQKQFLQFVQQTDKLKSTTQQSIDELQTLFDSLMQKYFG